MNIKNHNMIDIEKFNKALRRFNDFQQQIADSKLEDEEFQPVEIPIYESYTDEELIDICEKYHINLIGIITERGVVANNTLSDSTIKFLNVINDAIINGSEPSELLSNIHLSEQHYNRILLGEVPVKDRHWRPLITQYNVNPLFAFEDSKIKYFIYD